MIDCCIVTLVYSKLLLYFCVLADCLSSLMWIVDLSLVSAEVAGLIVSHLMNRFRLVGCLCLGSRQRNTKHYHR